MATIFGKSTVWGHEVGGTRGADRIFGSGAPGTDLFGGDGNDEISAGIPNFFTRAGQMMTPAQIEFWRIDLYGGIGNAPLEHSPQFTNPTATIGGMFRDGNDLGHIGAGVTSDLGSGRDTYVIHGGGFMVGTKYEHALRAEIKSFNYTKDHIVTAANDGDTFHFARFKGAVTHEDGQDVYHLTQFEVFVDVDNPIIDMQHILVRTVNNGHETPVIPAIEFHGSPNDEIRHFLMDGIGDWIA